jgi:hypothetical protein
VSLYKALGGGWKEGDLAETTSATDQVFRQ